MILDRWMNIPIYKLEFLANASSLKDIEDKRSWLKTGFQN